MNISTLIVDHILYRKLIIFLTIYFRKLLLISNIDINKNKLDIYFLKFIIINKLIL